LLPRWRKFQIFNIKLAIKFKFKFKQIQVDFAFIPSGVDFADLSHSQV